MGLLGGAGKEAGKEAVEILTEKTIPALDRSLDDFVADIKEIVNSLRGGKIHIEITFDFPEKEKSQ